MDAAVANGDNVVGCNCNKKTEQFADTNILCKKMAHLI